MKLVIFPLSILVVAGALFVLRGQPVETAGYSVRAPFNASVHHTERAQAVRFLLTACGGRPYAMGVRTWDWEGDIDGYIAFTVMEGMQALTTYETKANGDRWAHIDTVGAIQVYRDVGDQLVVFSLGYGGGHIVDTMPAPCDSVVDQFSNMIDSWEAK